MRMLWALGLEVEVPVQVQVHPQPEAPLLAPQLAHHLPLQRLPAAGLQHLLALVQPRAKLQERLQAKQLQPQQRRVQQAQQV